MRYAYVGCRTTKERNARGEGLKTYEIRPDGSWNCIQCLWDHKKNFLFTCAQGRIHGYGQMRALRYDHETGTLTPTLNIVHTGSRF